jgi:hypothetical protein
VRARPQKAQGAIGEAVWCRCRSRLRSSALHCCGLALWARKAQALQRNSCGHALCSCATVCGSRSPALKTLICAPRSRRSRFARCTLRNAALRLLW